MIGFSVGVSGNYLYSQSRFNPANLFGPADNGWYWEPSPDTLFQTNLGLVPATVGGAFGLQLDRSKGLALGPELTPSAASWSGSANWTVDAAAGRATLVAASGSADDLTLGSLIGDKVGDLFAVSFTIESISGGGIVVNSSRTSGPTVYTSAGTYTYFLSVSVVGAGALFANINTGGVSCVISGISVKLLPGNHGIQATAAARMVLRQAANGSLYYESDTTDDFLQTGLSLDSKRVTIAMAFRPLARNFVLLNNAGVSSPYALVGESGSISTNLIHSGTLHSVYFDNVLFTGTTRGQVYTSAQAAKSVILDITTSAAAWASPAIGKFSGTGAYYTPGDAFATLLIDRQITATERADLTASFMAMVP